MLELYHSSSAEISKRFTLAYTTSFAIGITLLDKPLQQSIYDIYGFVRLGDEIVDTFAEYNQAELLAQYKQDVHNAINNGISINPILHRFQITVRKYEIDKELVDAFLISMEMDLSMKKFEKENYDSYIYGSAEVVGLMCLKVFLKDSPVSYDSLKSMARLFGSVLQKINFLRDLAYDYNELQRSYFPDIDLNNFQEDDKQKILEEIYGEFKIVKQNIMRLPPTCRYGLYIIYVYYFLLYKKIKRTPASKIMNTRIRVSDIRKFFIFLSVKIQKIMKW